MWTTRVRYIVLCSTSGGDFFEKLIFYCIFFLAHLYVIRQSFISHTDLKQNIYIYIYHYNIMFYVYIYILVWDDQTR